MSIEKLDWFSAYDAVTIEDGKIIRTLIVPKKKKEAEKKLPKGMLIMDTDIPQRMYPLEQEGR